jgi:hypothetical protein
MRSSTSLLCLGCIGGCRACLTWLWSIPSEQWALLTQVLMTIWSSCSSFLCFSSCRIYCCAFQHIYWAVHQSVLHFVSLLFMFSLFSLDTWST